MWGARGPLPKVANVLFAAVVVPIVRYERPALIVVRRAAHLRRNPGQIAFPGGIVDASDAGSDATALREFEEEVGISRERVRLVSRLADVVTLAASVTVSPYVGVIEPPIVYAHDPAETASVHEIALAEIYVPGALRRGTERVEASGVRHDVPTWIFDSGELHVWGATAHMLADLVERFPNPDTFA